MKQDAQQAIRTVHAIAVTITSQSGGQAAGLATVSVEAQPVVVSLDPDSTAEIMTFAKQTAAAAASAKGSYPHPGTHPQPSTDGIGPQHGV